MGKRKSTIEELFDILFEATGMFWQVGAVVSVVLTALSVWSYLWLESLVESQTESPIVGAVVESLSWLYYTLPLILGLIAVLFGWKTYQVYIKQQRF